MALRTFRVPITFKCTRIMSILPHTQNASKIIRRICLILPNASKIIRTLTRDAWTLRRYQNYTSTKASKANILNLMTLYWGVSLFLLSQPLKNISFSFTRAFHSRRFHVTVICLCLSMVIILLYEECKPFACFSSTNMGKNGLVTHFCLPCSAR